jgi:hypothetical protein
MRKSILMMMSIFLLSVLSFAGNAPTTVRKAFELKFPAATDLRWDKENAHEYEASFRWKGEKYSANFSDSGVWLETESVSTFIKLPGKVQSAFDASHKGVKVKAVAKIETSTGIIKYEIELKQGIRTVEILYNEVGTELKN